MQAYALLGPSLHELQAVEGVAKEAVEFDGQHMLDRACLDQTKQATATGALTQRRVTGDRRVTDHVYQLQAPHLAIGP